MTWADQPTPDRPGQPNQPGPPGQPGQADQPGRPDQPVPPMQPAQQGQQNPYAQGMPPAAYAQPAAAAYAPPAGYGQQTGYGQPVPPRQPSRWMAVTALSIAIPAALLRFIPFVGGMFIPPVIVAIVFAIVALAVHTRGKGMSIAALIVGVVGLVVPFILAVLRFGLFGISLFGFIQDNV